MTICVDNLKFIKNLSAEPLYKVQHYVDTETRRPYIIKSFHEGTGFLIMDSLMVEVALGSLTQTNPELNSLGPIDYVDLDGSIGLVYKCIPVTLSRWMVKYNRGDHPQRYLRVCQQICQQVAELHAMGIVHNDLTRSNILIDDTDGADRVYIIDYGLSQFMGILPHGHFLNGGFLSNPISKAPDQFGDPWHCPGNVHSYLSDVYSIAQLIGLMYGLLTPLEKFVWNPETGRITHLEYHADNESFRVKTHHVKNKIIDIIGPDGYDLIQSMIAPSCQRITARQASNHVFFGGDFRSTTDLSRPDPLTPYLFPIDHTYLWTRLIPNRKILDHKLLWLTQMEEIIDFYGPRLMSSKTYPTSGHQHSQTIAMMTTPEVVNPHIYRNLIYSAIIPHGVMLRRVVTWDQQLSIDDFIMTFKSLHRETFIPYDSFIDYVLIHSGLISQEPRDLHVMCARYFSELYRECPPGIPVIVVTALGYEAYRSKNRELRLPQIERFTRVEISDEHRQRFQSIGI